MIFHVDPVRQIAIDDTLFINPYHMSKLTWRKDSATLSFEFDQRGHQVYRLIEADAETGKPRIVAEDEAKTFVNTGSGRQFNHEVNGLGNEVIWMSERDGWITSIFTTVVPARFATRSPRETGSYERS